MRPLPPFAVAAAFLLSGAVLSCPALRAAAAETAAAEIAEDEQVVKKEGLASDGAALLEFFRKRTLSATDQARISTLVRQLGDKAFRVRTQATTDLIRLGAPTVPALRRALKDPDVEVRARADKCIKTIQQAPGTAMAAARLLKVRKPENACAVLLAYLPFADDEEVEEEVVSTLQVLGTQGGKIDPVLPAALHAKHPARRAAAAYVLGRSGNAEQRQAVRRLLADTAAQVRFQAAHGLLYGRDKAALPVLVALLTEGPLDLARKAEELLADVSGTQVSRVELASDLAVRRQVQEAWSAWWKVNEAKIDLTRLEIDSQLVKAGRARKITLQCLNAFKRVDLESFKKTLQFPFYMEGMNANGKNYIETAAQLDPFLNSLKMATAQIKKQFAQITFAIQRVGRVNEYLKNAAPHEKTFLKLYRAPEVFVVYVKIAMNGQGQSEGAIFARVAAGRATVIGFGSTHQTAKNK